MLSLPLSESIDLLNHAIEQEQKENLYKLWLVRYPAYDKNTFETFDEFCDKCIPKRINYDTRSKDDIMHEILNIKSKEG